MGTDVPRNCGSAASRSTSRGHATPWSKGIIIADTKFEWGRVDDELILIDEVLTPDSSRFWPADQYQVGPRPAVVRQAVRARLAGNDRLGQEQPAPCPARRHRRQDAREVHRGLRTSDRPRVHLEVVDMIRVRCVDQRTDDLRQRKARRRTPFAVELHAATNCLSRGSFNKSRLFGP